MDNIQNKIFAAIRRMGRGCVFTPKDFLDAASRAAVDQSLSRLVRSGDIQRLRRGLFHYPQVNSRLGIVIAPDIDALARALGRQTGSNVAPSGAVAANRLGLSTQVPAQPLYLTDGRSKEVKIGNLTLQLKHVPPRELPQGSRSGALVIQALKHLGKNAIDEQTLATLRRILPVEDRRALAKDAQYTTDWIGDVLRRIAAQAPKGVPHG